MKNGTTILLFIFIHTFCRAQLIAKFEVQLKSSDDRMIFPVKTDLDVLTSLPGAALQLYAIEGKKEKIVPVQVYTGDRRWLYWKISDSNKTAHKLYFELRSGAYGKPFEAPVAGVVLSDSVLTLASSGRSLLSYVFATHYPLTGTPAKDTLFSKSGFIHPLLTPHGQVLTRINPWDHYHHYGLWDPWTHLVFEGDTVDCWNIGDKKGTVRFSRMLSHTEGNVFAEFRAVQEHIAFKEGKERPMLNEVQSVRIYPCSDAYYLADINIELTCATANSVLLAEYRYGGLGWRATEEWDRNNSEVLTSEGKSRKDADGSLARWCIVQGRLGNDYGGAVMLSYPANYNHPEPLRIWPENIFDRGDIFANFCPVKNKDWLLTPGNTYLLRYRFLVFNGHCTAAGAEQAWQDFADPPELKIVIPIKK